MSTRSMKRSSSTQRRMRLMPISCSSMSAILGRARARRGIMIRAGLIREIRRTTATWAR